MNSNYIVLNHGCSITNTQSHQKFLLVHFFVLLMKICLLVRLNRLHYLIHRFFYQMPLFVVTYNKSFQLVLRSEKFIKFLKLEWSVFNFIFPNDPLKNLSIIFCCVVATCSNKEFQVSNSPLLPFPSPKSMLKLGSEKNGVWSHLSF